MGRPSKLTPDLTGRLCGLLRDGVLQESAAWWLERAYPERWSTRRPLPFTPSEDVRIIIEDL